MSEHFIPNIFYKI